MSISYDWSPLFSAITGYAKNAQYQKLLESMGGQLPGYKPGTPGSDATLGTSAMPSQATTIDGTAPMIPGAPAPVQRSATVNIPGLAGTSGAAAVAPTAATPSPIQDLLRIAGPEVGMPLLLQRVFKQHKFGDTVHYDQSGNAFLTDDQGNVKPLSGVKERTKSEFVNGQAVDPYNTAPGTVIAPKADPNQPFDPVTGKPNPAYQSYQKSLYRARAEANADFRAPPKANVNAPIVLTHPGSMY